MSTDLPSPKVLQREVDRRRTFAIISHPDAGKTTMTEKLLLYGGAIHLAGSVKGRRAARHAVSDWMELEKQRGISITSSVLQFQYDDHRVNLLDTPGHADFSEDTYRTLAAADSAVMLMDVAKGVEPQTEKLFKVCRMRKLPIFTFVNKCDRHGRSPLELMEELENLLKIKTFPINWPIGEGKEFRGVYDRLSQKVQLFDSDGAHGESVVDIDETTLDDPRIKNMLGAQKYDALVEELELLDMAGEPFDLQEVLDGELTPMFFGSAMTNFGVQPFLEHFISMAPSPSASHINIVDPTAQHFSAFVFKIQANMNAAHRDRLAFMRVTSGRYTRDMPAKIGRNNRQIKLAYPQGFMADKSTSLEEAFAGDILGLYDPGVFRIGDTISSGDKIPSPDIPRFSPEHFAIVEIKDALKRKQLVKGLDQLSEEGTIQVFRQPTLGDMDAVVGAVGVLQFEVLKFRLEHEYNVEVRLRTLGFQHARWVDGAEEDYDERVFERADYCKVLRDRDDLPIILFRNDWALHYCKGNYPKLRFLPNPPGTAGLEELHGKGWI